MTEPCKECHPELHRSQCWEGGCVATRSLRSSETFVRPLATDAVGIPDLLPSSAGGPGLVGHPSDVCLGLGLGESGGFQCAQGELAEVVTAEGIDRDGSPVGGGGAANEVFDGGSYGVHVHASSVDDNLGRCQEVMTSRDVNYYRAKLRSLLHHRLGGSPGVPCQYCQSDAGDWCEYDCGSPFPILHPDYYEASDDA